MWGKVLKLEEKLPKQLAVQTRKQNTELAFAIALTKLGDFAKAEIYAKRAVQALERELKINKAIGVEENICPSKDPKEIAKFKIKMQSLCLAYHHLASVQQNIGKVGKAVELFDMAKAIGKKYVKDKKLLKIINEAKEKNIKKPSPMFSSKRVSMSEFKKEEKWQMPNDQQLLSEIFGKNKRKERKMSHAKSFKSVPLQFNNSFLSASRSSFDKSLKTIERQSSRIETPTAKPEDLQTQNKLRIANDISHLRKLETSAALTIQKFIRKSRSMAKPKHGLANFVMENIIVQEPPEGISPDFELQSPDLNSLEKIPCFSIEPSLIEYNQQENDDSDPDILVSFRTPLGSSAKKGCPTIFHYLNLSRPDLFISHSICGRIFSWKISIPSVKIQSNSILFQFSIIGNYHSFTDSLYYSTVVSYEMSKKLNQKFMLPFKFETVWPIVLSELVSEETEQDEENMDAFAVEVIKDYAYFILSKGTVAYKGSGSRLVFTENIEKFEEKQSSDYEPSEFLYVKEPVINKAILYAKHAEKKKIDIQDLYTQQELGSIGCILEKGIVMLSENYMLLNIEIIRSDYDKSAFSTCLQLKLIALQSNWFDNYNITFEELNEIFNPFQYSFSPFYLFATKKFPSKARDLLYTNFSVFFQIQNSKITKKLPKNEDLVDLHELVVSSKKLPEQCHEEWDAVMENLEDLNAADEIPNSCLGIITNLSLRGEVDKVHLRFQGVQKNVLIQAKVRMNDQILALLISDYGKISRILKIFEMREVVKSIFENEFCMRKGLCGKVLAFEAFADKKSFSAVRTIKNSKYIITITISETLVISLYSIRTCRDILTEFSKNDLNLYFPGVEIEQETAINYEKSFFNKLIDGFQLFRGFFGLFTGWVQKIPEDLTLETESKISAFQFSTVKTHKQLEIISVKPLFERRISNTLYGPFLCLMESVHQEKIILQKTRLICGLFGLITVTKLGLLEEWRIYLHFFQNSRDFMCKLYDSDMFALEDSTFQVFADDEDSVIKLWEVIIKNCLFEHHISLDFVFKFSQIIAPMRELLYSNHIKSSSHYYYEVYMKSAFPFNQRFATISSMKEAEYIVLTFRSYSLSTKVWVKTSLKLRECVLILLNKGVVNENILLDTAINYSQLKNFAGVLCRLVKMNKRENVIPVKLLPELEFSESEEEDYFEEREISETRSVSDVFEQDSLLYQSVSFVNPGVVIGIYFNRVAEEFAVKVYKPHAGNVYRVPVSKKQIFRVVPFSRTLLKNDAKIVLGQKILNYVMEKVLSKIP